MRFQIPPAALCAVAGALALAACQGKAPAAQAEADPAIAAALKQSQAAPAFAASAASDATALASAPPSTLGEPVGKGFNHSFNIVPAADPAAPATGGEATAEAGED